MKHEAYTAYQHSLANRTLSRVEKRLYLQNTLQDTWTCTRWARQVLKENTEREYTNSCSSSATKITTGFHLRLLTVAVSSWSPSSIRTRKSSSLVSRPMEWVRWEYLLRERRASCNSNLLFPSQPLSDMWVEAFVSTEPNPRLLGERITSFNKALLVRQSDFMGRSGVAEALARYGGEERNSKNQWSWFSAVMWLMINDCWRWQYLIVIDGWWYCTFVLYCVCTAEDLVGQRYHELRVLYLSVIYQAILHSEEERFDKFRPWSGAAAICDWVGYGMGYFI